MCHYTSIKRSVRARSGLIQCDIWICWTFSLFSRHILRCYLLRHISVFFFTTDCAPTQRTAGFSASDAFTIFLLAYFAFTACRDVNGFWKHYNFQKIWPFRPQMSSIYPLTKNDQLVSKELLAIFPMFSLLLWEMRILYQKMAIHNDHTAEKNRHGRSSIWESLAHLCCADCVFWDHG